MEWKELQENKMVLSFLHNWGRGKRHQPVMKKDRVKEIVKKHRPKHKPVGALENNRVRRLVFNIPCVGEGYYPWENKDASKPLHSGWNYGAWLQKRGFKRLGSGAYSTVYGHPKSDRVIKVTSGSQDNWIDYIQWAAKSGYSGNFAPKVYSWKHYDKGFSVAVVERMEKTLTELEYKEDAKLIESLLYPSIRGNVMARLFLDELSPGLGKFIDDFSSTFKGATDLYGKNMMLRRDGSFAITDPVCGQKETTLNRLRSKDFTSLSPAFKVFYASDIF